MYRKMFALLLVILVLPISALAQDQITSAITAAPSSISANATIMDWDFMVLRKGTNSWTCLPDNAKTEGTDPWCINEAWGNFLAAIAEKKDPSYSTVGVAYMLAGDTPVSNSDPFATEFTNDADWVTDLGAHLMILVPGENALAGYSTDPKNGGPWIMWPGTPNERLMIPIE